MLEASRRCRILLPKCTSIKFTALGPDRDFFIAALADVKIHRNFYEISLRCKGSGPPVYAGGFFIRPASASAGPNGCLCDRGWSRCFSPPAAPRTSTQKSPGRSRGLEFGERLDQ
jgi:hypothetical protein